MNNPEVPLFIDEPGNRSVFASIEHAEQYHESALGDLVARCAALATA